jgi:hypothetical protein
MATNAQPVGQCSGIVNSLKGEATAIAAAANGYWGHWENYVQYLYGPLRMTVPDPEQVAAQEKAAAGPFTVAIPNHLARFKASMATAQAQNCLSAAQLSVIVEPTIKAAKRVNFAQFPPDEQLEEPSGRLPPLMPKN